jgi:hypothetical protein
MAFDFSPDLPQSGNCRMSGRKIWLFPATAGFRVKTE